MRAIALLLCLPLGCRNRDADLPLNVDLDGPELVACDPGLYASDAEDVCVHGPECRSILAADPGAPTGLYVIDPDGLDAGDAPFEVLCDMDTDGGGWTVLDGATLEAHGWLEFEHVAGEGAPRMGWADEGAFLLAPEGARGCATMALRATAWLPITFDALAGSWLGAGEQEGSQHDDFHHELRWGEVTDDCRGHLKFGTDQDTLKRGGEWGMHWTGHDQGRRRFTFGPVEVATSSVIRWELMDQGAPEDVVISEIELSLR